MIIEPIAPEAMSVEEAIYKYTSLRIAVVAMRDAQRTYFKTRDKVALDMSKRLEMRVDNMLNRQ